MFRIRRNKSELIVLTGAIYSFVAYLTAFTLEILFIIDLTRRSNEILSAASIQGPHSTSASTSSSSSSSPFSSTTISDTFNLGSSTTNFGAGTQQFTSIDDDLFLRNTGMERFKFESIQAHITIACLAISILYFIVFIISLILIVALILHSTFMLLIWVCAMITMYLPEFCLVAYVSVYCWGPDTRNGQTEIVFYLIRAVLNAIFIFRAHKLFKQLNYEKNFFRFKSGGRTSVSSQFTGYDSPYFIGDSLSTTINPVFNSSTLNLNRYDYIRDHHFTAYGASRNSGGSSRDQSPGTNNSMFDQGDDRSHAGSSKLQNYSNNLGRSPQPANKQLGRFYLGDLAPYNGPRPSNRIVYQQQQQQQQQQQRQSSMLSINYDLAECELDLDYRTLGRPSRPSQDNLPPYSTQSLDRRNLRDSSVAEQVILRPLEHQPFEYLHRPGSSSNVNFQGR